MTLGHGASAIFIRDNRVVNGYQLERLTRVKGDSRFPSMAIEMIEKYDQIPDGTPIYVSHWNPIGMVDSMSTKHWNRSYLESKFPNSTIISTDMAFTHHDAHAYSALAYNDFMAEDDFVIVADGFGNLGEVLSIYQRVGENDLKLLKRVRGYNNSLGLLYQYATDYVGLKQNQDEWKLNAMANEVSPHLVKHIKSLAKEYADVLMARHLSELIQIESEDDPIYNLGALTATHERTVKLLQTHFGTRDKAEIALFLQTIVERVITGWIDQYQMGNVTLVGGCFLNVQLNGAIATHVPGQACAMPISGDEGAALGLYRYHHPEFTIGDEDFCWGKRNLVSTSDIQGLYFTSNLEAEVMAYLAIDYIVNVVRGDMEYGPRAYCNTSTLALPSEKNKEYINHLNERDACMPMCPVMTDDQYLGLFKRTIKVEKSVEHMIMALEFNTNLNKEQYGVSHLQINGTRTGRPQVVTDGHWMYPVCKAFGPLINTSFNNHGLPICFEMMSVVQCHQFMKERDVMDRVVTLVEVNPEN